METMTKKEVNKKIKLHKQWLDNKNTGEKFDLTYKDLSGINLSKTNLTNSNITNSNLIGATLNNIILTNANLICTYLSHANLKCAYLSYADLQYADLKNANLSYANLSYANLSHADLTGANLTNAHLNNTNLTNTIGLVKIMGVEPGNIYWKRFNTHLINYGYRFKVGLNKLRQGEIFTDDPRILCSSPGFHFASRSWCELNYPDRPLEAKIRIPLDAKINEPWATDGKASSDMIEILQVFDVKTGNDITDLYR